MSVTHLTQRDQGVPWADITDERDHAVCCRETWCGRSTWRNDGRCPAHAEAAAAGVISGRLRGAA